MRISLNWLKEYVEITCAISELSERLTNVGLEVEGIDDLGAKYQGFVVGKVLATHRHPNAEKLTLCDVLVGKDTLRIVCGAANVAAGQKVPVGLVGAVVPHNQHDSGGTPFTLTPVKLRGEISNGMICSAYELGLGEDKEGILVLADGAKAGTPLARHLGLEDHVLEIGITPNRPDAMSHFGVAREVAAFLGKKLKIPKILLAESRRRVATQLKVSIADTQNCPRYTARVVSGVRVGSSPKWLQDRLHAVGIRAVNNVVDVTNFVLMEMGQPLHAFDAGKIEGGKIIVRRATDGESFSTLDGKTRLLNGEMLMICDAKKSIAVAGVMGGASTEITNSTTNIIIESAYFHPRSIRRTSKCLGLSTDASQRFERGADPEITKAAADRAAALIQSVAGGEVLKGVVDVYPRHIRRRLVTLHPERLNEILGTTLTAATVSTILRRFEIKKISAKKEGKRSAFKFEVPSFRPDLEREIDLIEEAARGYGYDNLPTAQSVSHRLSDSSAGKDLTDAMRATLTGNGFREVVTNSMQELSKAKAMSEHVVELANPINKDMAALRPSLIPSMLDVVRNNQSQGENNLRLFEVGVVYEKSVLSSPGRFFAEFHEDERIIMVAHGFAHPTTWNQPAKSVDLFDLKGEVESFLTKIFLDKIDFIPYPTTKALTEKGLSVEINGEYVGILGEVREELLRLYEIDQPVFVAELSIEGISRHATKPRKFQPLLRFPVLLRDMAFVLSRDVSVGSMQKEIREAGQPLLRHVELFDLYAGEQVPEGKKSVAFGLEFSANDRTLNQEEVDSILQRIIQRMEKSFEATLRA